MDGALREEAISCYETALKTMMRVGLNAAKMQQRCHRKSVSCVLAGLSFSPLQNEKGIVRHLICFGNFVNGPSFNECTNEVGRCGCGHAEPKAVIAALERKLSHLWFLCTYSPCTPCANLIVESKVADTVIFGHTTEHDVRGMDILRRAGLHVVWMPFDERTGDSGEC